MQIYLSYKVDIYDFYWYFSINNTNKRFDEESMWKNKLKKKLDVKEINLKWGFLFKI